MMIIAEFWRTSYEQHGRQGHPSLVLELAAWRWKAHVLSGARSDTVRLAKID